MPTGSGKTWVQGLLAKHYCQQGKRVAIVEPNEDLKLQTSERLGPVDFEISFLTLEQFYKHGATEDILILDEYDCMVLEQPYYLYNCSARGLWLFRGRKVFAFSATSSHAIEKLLSRCVEAPDCIRCASEYELMMGASPIQDG